MTSYYKAIKQIFDRSVVRDVSTVQKRTEAASNLLSHLAHLNKLLHHYCWHCGVLLSIMLGSGIERVWAKTGMDHPKLHPNISLIIFSSLVFWGERDADDDRLICCSVTIGNEGWREGQRDNKEDSRNVQGLCVKTEKWGESKIRRGEWFSLLCIVCVGGVEQELRRHWLAWRDNKNSADMVKFMCVFVSMELGSGSRDKTLPGAVIKKEEEKEWQQKRNQNERRGGHRLLWLQF